VSSLASIALAIAASRPLLLLLHIAKLVYPHGPIVGAVDKTLLQVLQHARPGLGEVRVGLVPTGYGTHSLRHTKASPIYRRTKNLRAVQLLLGHSKLESTVRYLGIEVDDALELAEQTDG